MYFNFMDYVIYLYNNAFKIVVNVFIYIDSDELNFYEI